MNYSKNLTMLYRNNSPTKNHWFLNPNENSSLKDSELLECFESSDDHLPIPDLVSIQRSSFQNFIKTWLHFSIRKKQSAEVFQFK